MGLNRRKFANFLDLYLQHHLVRRDQENQSDLIKARQDELAKHQAAQKLLDLFGGHQDFADRARGMGLQDVAGVPIGVFARGANEYGKGVNARVSEAKNLNDLPTDSALEGLYSAEPGLDPSNRAPIETAMKARAEMEKKFRADMPPVAVNGYNAQTGAMEQQFLPGDPRLLTNKTVQTSPTPEQAGQNKGKEAVAAQPDTSLAFNRNEDATRGSKAASAGANQRAISAASAAYNPDYFEDEDGNIVGLVPDGKGGFTKAPLPPGLHKQGTDASGNRLPPSTVITTNAQGNTAELQGVKILMDLKRLGLDNSNDWADPKITQFLVGTLGAAPSDPVLADVNQRANYVQASILQSLMRGRPSKYLAELYTKHIPAATQSPKLLFHQLKRVLEENDQQRVQLKQSYPNLPDPTGGMTYQQFLQANPESEGGDVLGSALGKASALRKQGGGAR